MEKEFDYKAELKKSYDEFKVKNDCEPNAVWVRIEMKDPEGYDTPFFCGYVFFITDEDIDLCYNFGCIFKEKNGYRVGELDTIYYSNSLDDFISDVENGYTDFNVVDVDKSFLLETDKIVIHYGNKN